MDNLKIFIVFDGLLPFRTLVKPRYLLGMQHLPQDDAVVADKHARRRSWLYEIHRPYCSDSMGGDKPKSYAETVEGVRPSELVHRSHDRVNLPLSYYRFLS